jgi:hypothetical protein
MIKNNVKKLRQKIADEVQTDKLQTGSHVPYL